MSEPPSIIRFVRLARWLHRSALLRRLARCLARRRVLTQPFHGGRIAFNAVAHSWAWTGNERYESFDRELQDRLLELSWERHRFLDVGANIGAMTLSLLLRNLQMRALAVEPGDEAVDLLRRSLRLNHLTDRCRILNVAASAGLGRLNFDASGSVVGHVSDQGSPVEAVDLAELVHSIAPAQPFLAKIDVEGYEMELLPAFDRIVAGPGSCVIIELHPLGFHGQGDPERCFQYLRTRPGLSLRQLGGTPLHRVDPAQFTQIEVHWPA